MSQANEWEEHSSSSEERMGTSRHWATAHCLTFVVTVPVGCHLARWRGSASAHWGSGSSGRYRGCHPGPCPRSVCCTLRLCHSFKGGTLPTLLPHSPCRDFTPIIFWGTESWQSSVAASVLNSHWSAASTLPVREEAFLDAWPRGPRGRTTSCFELVWAGILPYGSSC